MEELDPYKVFKVQRNFDVDVVKAKYKRLCLKIHPDRNPGRDTTKLFQAISFCYQRLLEDYVARLSNKPHIDLKKASNNYLKEQSRAVRTTDGKFDVGKFNSLFSSHRLDDANDVGYEEWMKNTTAQNAAEEERKRAAVQLYRPQHMHTMDPNQAYELGTTSVQDFSRPVCMDSLGRRQRGLPYTDYRVAHTTTRLVEEENVEFKEYKNVQELEVERANVSYSMTAAEEARELREKKREAAREKAKMIAQQARDRQSFDQYDKIHMLMLGSGPN